MHAAVTPDNVEELFVQAGVPPEPDVLSIDVDGQDYWIWEAIEACRPRVVVIEYNAVLPPGRQLVQPLGFVDRWDGTDYFGASLDAVCALAERKRYRLVHTDLGAINAFFVRSDLADGTAPPEDQSRRYRSRRHPGAAEPLTEFELRCFSQHGIGASIMETDRSIYLSVAELWWTPTSNVTLLATDDHPGAN